ncbi:hypothetical protein L2728_21650 [Shewanella chilikensis]|uniref:hypothetical protein n=1 Tax=Shewanella TaxID=22 RepID=UPI002010A25D|nr:hypothetical protein [Shewanella chilikensis]MCL1164422.1 hypothetical protein [Shewanella chilikensis]
MSSLKSLFESKSIEQIQRDAYLAEEEERQRMELELMEQRTKAVTVRISNLDVVALDGLAFLLDNTSRQEVLSNIIYHGVRDAVQGYFSPYQDTDQVVAEFFHDCSKAAQSDRTYADIVFSKDQDKEGSK